MTLEALLVELAGNQVSIWADADQIKYRAPKGALTARLREEITRQKPQLLKRLQDKQVDDIPFPLAFNQQMLWFWHKLIPTSSAYNVAAAIRLHGEVDIPAMEGALHVVAARHAMLRSVFVEVEGLTAQRIRSEPLLPLTIVNAGGWNKSEVEQRVSDAAYQPFDLVEGPLWRILLFIRSPCETIFLIAAHHIIVDRWSMEMLDRDLFRCYEAARIGQTVTLPPVTASYREYVRWQAEFVSSPEGERQLQYWQSQLAGTLQSLELPFDRSRPSMQNHVGMAGSFHLDSSLTAQVRQLAQAKGCTLFVVLLAAFQVLLHRYTGQNDIIVSTPVTNRTRPEFDRTFGYCANTLALRLKPTGEHSFDTTLQRVREIVLEALENQDYPFRLLIEQSAPTNNRNGSPLTQVLFGMEVARWLSSSPTSDTEEPGRSGPAASVLESFPLPERAARFDLELQVREVGDSLSGRFIYSVELFDGTTIDRMADHFRVLLEGIVTDPSCPLSSLPILTESERRQLLDEWNDTAMPYPADRCLHQLFEEQVARTPDAPAVVFEETQLSYAELNARGNQLACHLRRLGVGPETLVAICVERSLELLVGLLGILKAGGAYLPLDPAYPKERLAFMLQDAQTEILLTQERLLESLSELPARTLCLDRDWAAISRQSDTVPTSGVTPEHLAYVIYTSGSTGQPKGVQIPHCAVVNLLHTMRERPGLTARDILLAVTTVSFDIAVLELFLPITVGATVVIADHETAADGMELSRVLTASGATVLQATPITWRLLLAAGWQPVPRFRALCGGEALPADLARTLLDVGVELWNMYGPTETTIWSAIHQVADIDGLVPIGRPVGNTQLYVLSQALQLQPVGVVGELYIGGAGVARGYLHRPELTDERFIPDPFNANTRARLYRAGDLARLRPNGLLEVLGRTDHQVKIRGFRIELGEIEAVLREQVGIRDAVVVVREDTPGDQRLVAYVVPTDVPPTTDALRAALRGSLPDYMVPAMFVMLEALPLTPNGKVDRKALPAPDLDAVRGHTFVAPSTVTEVKLAAIWAEVLGTRQIGVNDNFFELGGHSLSAIQVQTRVRNAFGVEIPLLQLFETPTIVGLTPAITEREGGFGIARTDQTIAPFMRPTRRTHCNS